MCNPRRIRVNATRQLNEAWQREVSRTVELRESVTGAARVRQPLDTTLGRPALRALETALANPASGWTEVDEGYRFDVEGGYVTYLVEEQALEIVAELSGEVQAMGQETQRLEGVLQEELLVEGEGHYYDDGWGGRTKEVGEREAQAAAVAQLDLESRERVRQAQAAAEAAAESGVTAQARFQAEERLRVAVAARQAMLAEQARLNLEAVGVRGRQVFHRILGQAYRDAILAYARTNGADGIQCRQNGDVIEIEFNMQR